MKRILLFLIVATMTTCKKDVVTGPQGPKGDPGVPVAPGRIIGKVSRYGANGSSLTTNLQNSTVTLEGQNKSTVTDASGNYTFTNIAPGVYSMKFERPQAGIYKNQQVSHPGNGDLIINASLYDKPTWELTSFMIEDTTVNTSHYLKMSFEHPVLPQGTTAFVYFSRNENIDPANRTTYDSFIGIYLATNSTKTEIPPQPYDQLLAVGYTTGTVFYAQAFPVNPNSSYLDYLSGQTIYTGSGTPFTIVGLIMP